MSVKKFIFILITVSFTVILLLVFKHIPANTIPYIKDYVPVVYIDSDGTEEDIIIKEKEIITKSEPKVEIKETMSISSNEINYTASQYHNFEKIIDELIIETKEY